MRDLRARQPVSLTSSKRGLRMKGEHIRVLGDGGGGWIGVGVGFDANADLCAGRSRIISLGA